MAQNSQAGTVEVVTQNGSLQLHIPGMSQFKNLEFIQSADHPTDLVVKFPDGSEIVFPNYIPLAQAGSPPAVTLDDGTVIPGQEIVGLIDNLNYDLIAPGAGDQGGDGANTGSAAFIADPSGPLGDDIGHGPYAGGIHIADQVGFEQLPGYIGIDGGGGGGGDLVYPDVVFENNRGDTYSQMDDTSLTLSGRSAFSGGPLEFTLQTQAPGGVTDDWDGMRVHLEANEVITVTHDPLAPGQYYIGIDTDGNTATGTDPVISSGPYSLGLEDVSLTGQGPISYETTVAGEVYVTTGFGHPDVLPPWISTPHPHASPAGEYNTQIHIGSLIQGTAGDDDGSNALTGGVNWDHLYGNGGNDELYGGAGNDQLTGGAGNDHLTGGSGSDLFLFENAATDGNDTVFDFNAAQGDIINLDALFDTLGVATREVLSHESGGNTILTIGDGTGTDTALAAASGFSVTLDGSTGLDIAQLTTDGNIVVDQS